MFLRKSGTHSKTHVMDSTTFDRLITNKIPNYSCLSYLRHGDCVTARTDETTGTARTDEVEWVKNDVTGLLESCHCESGGVSINITKYIEDPIEYFSEYTDMLINVDFVIHSCLFKEDITNRIDPSRKVRHFLGKFYIFVDREVGYGLLSSENLC